MNKVLLLLTFVPCAVFAMEKSAENFTNFITMEHKHKLDWLDYKKAQLDTKIDLVKKHKNQFFELKKKYMSKMAKGENPQTYLDSKLNDMIKLHEEQNLEWKEMCEANHKKGADIAQSHKTELDNFKKSILPPETKATEAKEKEADKTLELAK